MEIGETLEVRNPKGFMTWLKKYGLSSKEIWLVIYKKSSGKRTVTYEQLVEAALCYGWIDGLMKSIDDEKYAQRFTPRRKNSNWTETNRSIARRLLAEGLMSEAGRAVLPDDLS